MQRPYTICHMMSSIDGKIASGVPGLELFGKFFDLYTKTEDEIRGQAWMCGRVTMEMFAKDVNTPLHNLAEVVDSEDYIGPNTGSLFMIGVDTKGTLRWKGNTIKLSNVKEPLSLVVVVLENTSKKYLNYLRSLGISYIVCGKNSLDFERVLGKLSSQLKIQTLLVEGGGGLNGSMLAANVIDEMSLLLLPVAVNHASSPSVFNQQSELIQMKNFSLMTVKPYDRETIWLRYKRKK